MNHDYLLPISWGTQVTQQVCLQDLNLYSIYLNRHMNHQPCRLQGPRGLAVINHSVPWSVAQAPKRWVCECVPFLGEALGPYILWNHILKCDSTNTYWEPVVLFWSFIYCYTYQYRYLIWNITNIPNEQIGSDIALLVSLNYHLSILLKEVLTETEIYTCFYSAICICIFLCTVFYTVK